MCYWITFVAVNLVQRIIGKRKTFLNLVASHEILALAIQLNKAMNWETELWGDEQKDEFQDDAWW